MDVDELVNEREKNKHGVDDILLARWAAVVEELEESVETVADEEAEKKTDHKYMFSQLFLWANVVLHIPAMFMLK